MIGTQAILSLILMIVLGLVIPFGVAVWWIKTRKEKATTVLLGAATWFVFAMILETVPKAILFNPALAVGKAVTESVVLYTVCGALLAGLFEETGRLLVFRTLLRKRTNRETAVSHGVGHGGMEAFFTLTVGGLQNAVFAVLIGTGKLQAIIDQVAGSGADVAALQALPEQLAALTPGTVCLSAAERVFAMLLHVGLSVIVFCAVQQSKPLLYISAIILHALFDVPAALYQRGVIRSMYVCEALIAAYAVVFFAAIFMTLYRKYGSRTSDAAPFVIRSQS